MVVRTNIDSTVIPVKLFSPLNILVCSELPPNLDISTNYLRFRKKKHIFDRCNIFARIEELGTVNFITKKKHKSNLISYAGLENESKIRWNWAIGSMRNVDNITTIAKSKRKHLF